MNPRSPSPTERPSGARGQILVIFAGGMILFLLLMALIIDVGWYWSGQLKMQRAADAAALAGVVYLPGDYASANKAVLAIAKMNGYVPDADTSVTSAIDANNIRQLDVTITDKIGTFFLRTIGIQGISATRSSRALYVVPVPMGSPQNYYGVYQLNCATGCPSAGLAGFWRLGESSGTNAADASGGGHPGTYANSPTLGQPGALAGDPNTAVRFNGSNQKMTTSALPAMTNLTFAVWVKTSQTTGTQRLMGLYGPDTTLRLVNGAVAAYDSSGGSITFTTSQSVADGNWHWVVMTRNGSSGLISLYSDGTRIGTPRAITPSTVSSGPLVLALRSSSNIEGLNGTLDEPTVWNRVLSDDEIATLHNGIPDAVGSTPPPPQGFFGGVITTGGSTENGDLLNPTMDRLNNIANPSHIDEGFDYTIIVPANGGQVSIFDPTFCGMGPTPASSTYGEGDHWIGTSGVPVNTYYRLYDTKNTPLTTADDVLVASSGYMFTNEDQTDQSGTYGTPQSGGAVDCSTGKIVSPSVGGYWHNKWWLMGANVPVGSAINQTPGTAGNLTAGTYRLQVTTTDPASPSPASLNANVNAENMFSIEVNKYTPGVNTGQVYGAGMMANWYSITNGIGSTFYLAQIDKTYAGKTLQINLWDVGDNQANSYLKIMSPDGGGTNSVDFTYTSAELDGTVGPGGSITAGSLGLQTTSCSGSSCNAPFSDKMLTIQIPLNSSYGTSLWVDPNGQSGWWQVQYNVSSGNDTTTWQVNVLGNPVHLLVP